MNWAPNCSAKRRAYRTAPAARGEKSVGTSFVLIASERGPEGCHFPCRGCLLPVAAFCHVNVPAFGHAGIVVRNHPAPLRRIFGFFAGRFGSWCWFHGIAFRSIYPDAGCEIPLAWLLMARSCPIHGGCRKITDTPVHRAHPNRRAAKSEFRGAGLCAGFWKKARQLQE